MAYFTLDELQVASPCSVPWSSMDGGDNVRFCADCRKNVYDLSMLTRAEANELIREKEGNLCVSFYKRRDGTILTSDCPVALRGLKRQYLKARAKVIAAGIAICAYFALSATSCGLPSESRTAGMPARIDSLPIPDSSHH